MASCSCRLARQSLGRDSLKLTILHAPQNIVGGIAPPTEVGCIPTMKVLVPVSQEIGVVGGAPTSGNRITNEVHIDRALIDPSPTVADVPKLNLGHLDGLLRAAVRYQSAKVRQTVLM